MEETLERALVHARRAQDDRQREEIAVRLGIAAVIGPLPVEHARPASTSCSRRRPTRAVDGPAARLVRPARRDGRRLRRGAAPLPGCREVFDALEGPVAAASIATWSSA